MQKLLFSLVFVLVVCTSASAQPYSIGHHSEASGYNDPARNRLIPSEVYYPANAAGDDVAAATGQFPVIVFGHGFTLKWDAYNYFWEYFVPKGYICVFPTTEGSLSPNHGNFGADLAFLSAYFPTTINSSDPILQGHVDAKVAIMGHSMGGGSTYLACQNNTQPTTMVSLAAANTNPSSITAAANITIPALLIAGDEDCVAPTPANSLAMYNALPLTSCKYLTELKGASHCHFTYGNSGGSSALCYSAEGFSCIGWGPFITAQQQHDRMFLLIEPWFRYHLQANPSGWTDFLTNIATMNGNTQLAQEMHNCTINVGINPTSSAANIKVFPSPTQSMVNLDILLQNEQDLQVAFSDLQGKVLLAFPLSGKTHYAQTISIESWAQGIYLLTIKGKEGIWIQKIMK